MPVRDIHSRGLATSASISEYFMPNAITPHEVISILNEAGIRFILVGAYGLVGWTKTPRATLDIDVVVMLKHVKKATQALLTSFPQLEATDEGVVVRLRDRETREVAIDVMKNNQQLYRVAFKHTHRVHAKGQTYEVPSLEMALAMKFAPMVSPHRIDQKKHLDAHDFIAIVRSNLEFNMDRLATLGDLVHPEGGKELIDMVRAVRAGEKLKL